MGWSKILHNKFFSDQLICSCQQSTMKSVTYLFTKTLYSSSQIQHHKPLLLYYFKVRYLTQRVQHVECLCKEFTLLKFFNWCGAGVVYLKPLIIFCFVFLNKVLTWWRSQILNHQQDIISFTLPLWCTSARECPCSMMVSGKNF